MKINNAQLANLIKEEINKVLNEQEDVQTQRAAEKAGRAYYAGDDETYGRISGKIGPEAVYAQDQAVGGRMQQHQAALAAGDDPRAAEDEAGRKAGALEASDSPRSQRAQRAAAARQTGAPVGGTQAAKPGAGPATPRKGAGAPAAKAGPAKAGPALGGAAASAGSRAAAGREPAKRSGVASGAGTTRPSPQASRGGRMREVPSGDQPRGRETLSELIDREIDNFIYKNERHRPREQSQLEEMVNHIIDQLV